MELIAETKVIIFVIPQIEKAEAAGMGGAGESREAGTEVGWAGGRYQKIKEIGVRIAYIHPGEPRGKTSWTWERCKICRGSTYLRAL